MANEPTQNPSAEEIARLNAQRQAMMEQSTSNNGKWTSEEEGSIWGTIVKFLEFLWDTLFSGKDAPQESETPEPPMTTAQKVQASQDIIDSRAIPNWEEFKRKHKGEKVEHISPVAGPSVVTSGFGHRHVENGSSNHKGADLGSTGSNRTPDIVATARGTILYAGYASGYGNTVIVGHGDGSFTLYGHMSGEKMPKLGSEVPQGAVIGVMGNSGNTNAKTSANKGIHLHYEQRKGNEVYEPIIKGVPLKVGVSLAAAPSAQTLAQLPPNLPQFAVSGGTPTALAFSAVNKTQLAQK